MCLYNFTRSCIRDSTGFYVVFGSVRSFELDIVIVKHFTTSNHLVTFGKWECFKRRLINPIYNNDNFFYVSKIYHVTDNKYNVSIY